MDKTQGNLQNDDGGISLMNISPDKSSIQKHRPESWIANFITELI